MKKLALIQDYHPNFFDTYKELEKHYDLEMIGDGRYFNCPKEVNNKLWKTKVTGNLYFGNPHTLFKHLRGHKLAMIKDFSQPKSLVAIILCRLMGIKYVVTIQKISWADTKFKKRLLDLVAKRIVGRNTPIICSVKAGFVSAHPYFNNLHYVPFAIKSKTTTKKYDIAGDVLKVLCVGKLTQERKNQTQLIKYLSTLLLRNQSLELTLVGDCKKENEYSQRLRQSAKGSRIKVIVKPNVAREDMQREYLDADVFMLSSRREPAAYSVLEAMSYGLCAITSADNGTRCYLPTQHIDLETDNYKINWVGLKKEGKRNVVLAKKNHDPKVIVAKHVRILEELKC